MIQVIVKKKKDHITGFHIEGHSGYAGHGSDIICAAVSALAVNCVNSVERFTDDRFRMDSDEDKGMIDFQFLEEPSEDARLLLNSMTLGLEEISRTYGSRYVTLINR